MNLGRATWMIAVGGVLLGARALVAAPPSGGDDPVALYRALPEVFRSAMARVTPSVVTIETVGGIQPPAAPIARSRPAGDRGRVPPRRSPSVTPSGSRFIIGDGPTTGLIYSADGLILTSAFNFVRDPSLITVILADGRRFIAELLARDEVRRLAMLQIEAADLPTPEWIGGASDVRVGAWALALGRGFAGKECAISAGIISGLNRQNGLAVQTDAKLSPANFGGPLIDIDGRVIGICVPMGMGDRSMAGVEWYDSGIGFVIPWWQVRRSAEDLAVGHALRRGLLGVSINPHVRSAVRVMAVADPSPAGRAGIQSGDHILSMDGEEVSSYPELRRVLRTRYAGERVTITIDRQGEEIELRLRLGVPEDIGPLPSFLPEPDAPGPEAQHPDDESPDDRPKPQRE